jgi:uncharacterized protein YbaR (Trm112 family)/SAM-dependent methyltransferase
MTLILDVGCGPNKVKDAFGIDIVRMEGVNAIVDLFHLPLPFADDTFDEIYFNDVIEHLPNTIKIMEEIHRIARKDARVFIRVVNWNSSYTAADPTHIRAFTEISFDFYGGRPGRNYYTKARFDVMNVEFQYSRNVQKVIRSKRIMRFMSHFLCNVLEGLTFKLRVVKEGGSFLPMENENIIPTRLQCPRCAGKFVMMRQDWLSCMACYNNYPIVDGVPVLLVEEAAKYKDNLLISSLPTPSVERYPVIKND